MDSRSDILIENGVGVWSINIEGDIQGTYTGIFKFRCFLTPTQQIAAGREYRELLGPNPSTAPEHESFLAYSLTQLKYRVVQAPPFWSSTLQLNNIEGDIPDHNVITEVLNAAIDTELKYKTQLNKRKLDALERAKKAAAHILKEQGDEVKNEDDENQEDEG